MSKANAVLIVLFVLLAIVSLPGCGTSPLQERDDKVMRYDACMKEFHSYVVCDKKVGLVIR